MSLFYVELTTGTLVFRSLLSQLNSTLDRSICYIRFMVYRQPVLCLAPNLHIIVY